VTSRSWRRGWRRRRWRWPQVAGATFAVEMAPEERASRALEIPRHLCIRHRITAGQRLDAACVDLQSTRVFDAEVWRTGARVYVGRGRSAARDLAVARRILGEIADA